VVQRKRMRHGPTGPTRLRDRVRGFGAALVQAVHRTPIAAYSARTHTHPPAHAWARIDTTPCCALCGVAWRAGGHRDGHCAQRSRSARPTPMSARRAPRRSSRRRRARVRPPPEEPVLARIRLRSLPFRATATGTGVSTSSSTPTRRAPRTLPCSRSAPVRRPRSLARSACERVRKSVCARVHV
jgi:hypothetical protein